MRKQHPSVMFRIAAVWDLVCGHCGKTYDFDHSTGSVLGEHPQPEVIRGCSPVAANGDLRPG